MLLFHLTTNKLEIAFTKVSTVEIVKANPSAIIIKDTNSVCSFNNNVKNPRSGLLLEVYRKRNHSCKTHKKTIGTTIKKK